MDNLNTNDEETDEVLSVNESIDVIQYLRPLMSERNTEIYRSQIIH